ncbi:hypothetical protein MJ564_14680 [Escherichia coli]|nr:hypothetical protein MJ564_14680 [Escherichia coli]
MVQAKPRYVEDRVTSDKRACVIKMLRITIAHALITIWMSAKRSPTASFTLLPPELPDIYYGWSERTGTVTVDRRMFGKKMRHVGDRVAAVVAESEDIAPEALKLIDVEYEVLKPVR